MRGFESHLLLKKWLYGGAVELTRLQNGNVRKDIAGSNPATTSNEHVAERYTLLPLTLIVKVLVSS